MIYESDLIIPLNNLTTQKQWMYVKEDCLQGAFNCWLLLGNPLSNGMESDFKEEDSQLSMTNDYPSRFTSSRSIREHPVPEICISCGVATFQTFQSEVPPSSPASLAGARPLQEVKAVEQQLTYTSMRATLRIKLSK